MGEEELEVVDSEVRYQLVCFKLAEEEYAININDIQEVIGVQEITHIPQMPEFVLGVANLRGYVVSVFDLRKKLHLDAKPFDDQTKIVFALVDGTVFGLIVDEILENVTLPESSIDPAPSVKMKISKECIFGLGELEGRMITILNLAKIQEEINSELGIDALAE